MGSGYVCDFSNRTFSEFVIDSAGIEIYQEKYESLGTSKANRLRAFWRVESDLVVGALLNALIEYNEAGRIGAEHADDEGQLVAKARSIVKRLSGAISVDDLDALKSDSGDRKTNALARLIQESVERGRPEEALDRLHTYVTGWVRGLCTRHAIPVNNNAALHAQFGAYVRFLRESNLVESKAPVTILRSSVRILDDLNAVRNNQSLAHFNELLSRNEATLIFRHISSTVKFIREVEKRIQEARTSEEEAWEEPEFSEEEIEAAGDRWIQQEIDIRRGR